MTQGVHSDDLFLVTPLREGPDIDRGLSVGEIRSVREVLN